MARVRRCHEIEPGDPILGDHEEEVVVTRVVPLGGARILYWVDEHGAEKQRLCSHFMGIATPGEPDASAITDIMDDTEPFAERLGPPIPRAV
jgi:hypothetical protein